VDDEPRSLFAKRAPHGVKVEQVKFSTCQSTELPLRREARRGLNKIISDQPAGAGDPS